MNLTIKSILAATLLTAVSLNVAEAEPLATDGTPGALEEVVVTAEKREEPISHVPMAVTAFDGAALDAEGKFKLEDFISEAPGVSNRPTGNGFASIEIRGLSSATGDGTLGFYLDEVPFSLLGSTISPNMASYDLDRVEVLRGPQGTLYGQGSMGGAIKLITNSPDLTTASAKLDLASGVKTDGRPDYSFDTAVNVPIVQDRLALRVVVGHHDDGGYLDDARTGRKDVNGADSWNYRAKLLFSPNDDLRITGSAWIERDQSNFSNGGFANRTLVSGPGVDFLDVDTHAFNLLVNYALPFADLTSSSSYLTFKYASSNNSTILSPGASTDLTSDSGVTNKVFSEELRLVSRGSGPFRWSVGGLYSDARANALANVDALTTVPSIIQVGTLTDATDSSTSRNWSAFGEASYLMFNGFLEPTLGLRYFTDDRGGVAIINTTQTMNFLFPGPPPSSTFIPGTPQAGAGTFSSVDPRFNLSFHWSNDLLSYVSAAKGFRSGSFNSAQSEAIAASYGVTATKVEPDSIWTYELGSKALLAEGMISLEGALYYSIWDRIQLLVTDPITFTAFTVNGGKARIQGVEYGITYRPLSGLSLKASGNLNESTLKTVDPNLAPLTFLHAGDRLDYVPKRQLDASGTYAWNLPWGTALQGFVYAAADYHSSLTQTTTSGILEGNSVTVANIRGGVQSNKWGAYLYVANLLDANPAVTRNTDGTAVRLEPRVIGLAIHVNTK